MLSKSGPPGDTPKESGANLDIRWKVRTKSIASFIWTTYVESPWIYQIYTGHEYVLPIMIFIHFLKEWNLPNLVVTIRDTHQDVGLRGQMGIILTVRNSIFQSNNDLLGMRLYNYILVTIFIFQKIYNLKNFIS